jgi:hypothetical protein
MPILTLINPAEKIARDSLAALAGAAINPNFG